MLRGGGARKTHKFRATGQHVAKLRHNRARLSLSDADAELQLNFSMLRGLYGQPYVSGKSFMRSHSQIVVSKVLQIFGTEAS
jgi:hypothetical protein